MPFSIDKAGSVRKAGVRIAMVFVMILGGLIVGSLTPAESQQTGGAAKSSSRAQ